MNTKQKRYGFRDAFNPTNGWLNPDVIGIDLGVTVLMIENLRTGFVWDLFMNNDQVERSMDLVGFKPNSAVAVTWHRILPFVSLIIVYISNMIF